MKLRTKLLLFWGAFVLLMWGGTIWPVARTLDANFATLSNQAFTGARKGLAAMQDERLKRMRQASALVMNIPELRALIAEHSYEIAPANMASLEERLDYLAGVMGARLICVLDQRGGVIAQNHASPWSSVPALQRHIATHPEAATLVSALYEPRRRPGDIFGIWGSPDGLMQTVAVPLVFDQQATDQTIDGALLIGTDVSDEFAADLSASHGCEMTFFMGNRVVATSVRSVEMAARLPLIASLANGSEATIDGVPYRVSSETLQDPCSGREVGRIVIQSDQTQAHAVRSDVYRALVGILLAGLLATVVGTYALSGTITGPISRLVTGVNRVAAGDLTLSLEADGTHELGTLARAFNDMVQQVAARYELERHMKETEAVSLAKSRFLATMSHEIRTPLNGVIGMADLLLTTRLDERQKRYCSLVKSSAEVLTTLVNDILDFAKIESGKLEIESIDFDLHTLLEESVELFAPRAHGKGLALICHITAGTPRLVRGDPNRLRQVVVNLLNNAIKFTQAGSVTLRVQAVPGTTDMLRVEVIDTGIGISDEQKTRLFQAFSQVDASTTRKYGGTGLGLAICKQLSGLMGGEVGVDSRPDQGSAFWFTVRCPPADRGQQPPVSPSHWAGLRALVIEPCVPASEALCERLRDWGFTVATSPSDDFTPDVAIVADGVFERSGRRMPCPVLVAARSEESFTAEVLREMGAAGVVSLPLCQGQLAAAITTALEPRAERATIAPAPAKAVATDLSGVRVLVADDHEVNRLVVVELLSQCGVQSEQAADGAEAVRLVKGSHFDLVLMDCHMPVMDGLAATRQIRAEQAAAGTPPVPIIALTANTDDLDRQRCLDSGMNAFCTKPIQRELLLSTMAALLHRSAEPKPAAPVPEPPSVATPAAAAFPLDWQRLVQRCSGNRTLALRIRDKLVEQATAALAEIERGLAASDPPAIARAAHGLKGAAGMAAAGTLQKAAADIESIAKAGSTEGIATLLAEVKHETGQCRSSVIPDTAPTVRAA